MISNPFAYPTTGGFDTQPASDNRHSSRRRGGTTWEVPGPENKPSIVTVDPMKILKNPPPGPQACLLAVALGLAGVPGLSGAPFLYAPGDLLLTLRQPGNASDLVVNIGSASTYSTLPGGKTQVVAQLNTTLLKATFPNLNGLAWSVLAANRPPVVPEFPLQTLWVAGIRPEPGIPSSPWLRKGQFVQGNAGAQIDAIGKNAAAFSSAQPAGPANTASAVAIPVGHAFAVGPTLGDPPNLVGTFQGRVESVTPDDFDTDLANVSRSDLYELVPGTRAEGTLDAPGRLLGVFELKADGTLTFSTPSQQPPVPVISKISYQEGGVAVTFRSTSGVTYRLRSTDESGLSRPVSTWTAGVSVVGDGSDLFTLQDSSTTPVRFFAVEAVR